MRESSKRRLKLVHAAASSHSGRTDGPRRIAVLALPKSALSDVAGPYEAFLMAGRLGQHKLKLGQPFYEVTLVSVAGRSIATLSGLRVEGATPLSRYKGFPDTLMVTGEADSLDPRGNNSTLFHWVRQAAVQSRRVCSVCTGVFCLAAAGVLSGRRVTTHWQHAGALAHKYRSIEVDPEPVFLRDDKFYSSAGCTAAVDLSLTLIEEDLGVEIATEIALATIMPLRRPSSQPQISALLRLQMSDREPLRALQGWILEHLRLPLTVEDLAAQVHMSPRNFARSFVAGVGTTPARFLETLRLEAARRRLEETNRSVDQIAGECGFGSAEVMRRSFVRNLGVAPTDYRQRTESSRPRRA